MILNLENKSIFLNPHEIYAMIYENGILEIYFYDKVLKIKIDEELNDILYADPRDAYIVQELIDLLDMDIIEYKINEKEKKKKKKKKKKSSGDNDKEKNKEHQEE